MSEHTPEPWAVTDRNEIGDRYIGPAHGHPYAAICVTGIPPFLGNEAEANARRIVACVNACAGVPTEELEEVAKGSIAITVDDVIQDAVTAIEEAATAKLNAAEERKAHAERITRVAGELRRTEARLTDSYGVLKDLVRWSEQPYAQDTTDMQISLAVIIHNAAAVIGKASS